MQLLQVHAGYWSGYYTNSRHAKSIKDVTNKMVREKEKATSKYKQKHADEVDVEAFLAREQSFLERLNK